MPNEIKPKIISECPDLNMYCQYVARALKAEAKLEHLSHRLYCPSCNDFIVPFEKKDNSAIFCDAMNLLEKLGAKYYIKNDLRKHMKEK